MVMDEKPLQQSLREFSEAKKAQEDMKVATSFDN